VRPGGRAGLTPTTARVAIRSPVACTSFHNPATLAKIATTVDEISGGCLDDHGHPVEPDHFDLGGQVCGELPNRLGVLLKKRRVQRLAGHDPADTPVHLERPDRRDQDCHVRSQARRPARDVEELLVPHVGAEAGLRADHLVRRQDQPVG
jgi:hypothetical protein